MVHNYGNPSDLYRRDRIFCLNFALGKHLAILGRQLDFPGLMYKYQKSSDLNSMLTKFQLSTISRLWRKDFQTINWTRLSKTLHKHKALADKIKNLKFRWKALGSWIVLIWDYIIYWKFWTGHDVDYLMNGSYI